MNDDDEHERPATPDPDRAAILARRQRFVAFALSGLTTTACTDGSSKPADSRKGDTKSEVTPDACLKVKVEEQDGPETQPQPCLSFVPGPPPPPEPTTPKVCLKIASPEEPEPVADPEPIADPEPAPRPCLRKAPPKPCLKQAPPDE